MLQWASCDVWSTSLISAYKLYPPERSWGQMTVETFKRARTPWCSSSSPKALSRVWLQSRWIAFFLSPTVKCWHVLDHPKSPASFPFLRNGFEFAAHSLRLLRGNLWTVVYLSLVFLFFLNSLSITNRYHFYQFSLVLPVLIWSILYSVLECKSEFDIDKAQLLFSVFAQELSQKNISVLFF